MYNVQEIFDRWVGNNEETRSWSDTATPVIFIYFPMHTIENKRTEELILHIISYRRLAGLITIVLTEKPLPPIEALYNARKVAQQRVSPLPKTITTVVKPKQAGSHSIDDDIM